MTAAPADAEPASGRIDLTRKTRWRSVFSSGLDGIVFLATCAAIVPLFSVLYMVLRRGAANFRFPMLWSLPTAARMDGGGFGNALVGTLILVGIGAVASVPLGVLTAIFLTEYSRGSRGARLIRFAAKILSGLPSILAGVFISGVLVITTRRFSAIAGRLALGILMLPIVILVLQL